MINLRKPSQAFVPDGSITKEKLADNAVDASKIEDGAIDLSTAKVIGELPETKLADNAVTETKIANEAVSNIKLADGSVLESKIAALAISTGKLQDNVVTLAKSNDDIKVSSYVGGEEEQASTGDVEVGIIETGFIKVVGKYVPRLLRVFASLKTSDALKQASLKIYIDEEVDARITLNSTSIVYELLNAETNISDLGAGRHKITAKLVNAEADGISSNDYIDFYFVK
jgi:hypothetical protein